MSRELIPAERIENRILLLRGQKVLLDRDLASLYEVETRALNQAVRRNRDRFPDDFMFSLTRDEIRNISQSVICSDTIKHARNVYAFTEQGVAMLSSVLNSKRAIQVNIAIMRTFARLRHILASHADLALKLEELEKRYDKQFRVVFDALRELMMPPEPPQKQIGFRVREGSRDVSGEALAKAEGAKARKGVE
ncbi:MAG: ORF6N domain-containing protein [Kiritimatiellia bacterium]